MERRRVVGPHSLSDDAKRIRRVLLVTLILNVSVAAMKMLYGWHSGSIGMLSDGFHSLFDGASNIVGLVGIWIASRPPDAEHPYGHSKFETLFTVAISLMIFGACFRILNDVYRSVFETHAPPRVTALSFAVMAATMAVNVFVMTYEGRQGRALKSDFLIADALHTKSDVLASSSVILGLIFSHLGYRHADAIAGAVVVVLIARVGWGIIRRASDVLVDTVCLDTHAIEMVVRAVEGVRNCHGIRTRGAEAHVSLDLSIHVSAGITVESAHEIADEVERRIREAFPEVEDIVVHTEPEDRQSESD